VNIYRKYWRRYWFPFIVAVLCVFCEALCDLMMPTITAEIIDRGVKVGDLHNVLVYGGIMLGIAAIGTIFASSRNILSGKVSQSFGADLREDTFQKILSFSLESVDKIESGSLITRLTNDISQITQFVNGMMRIFFKAPLTCIGSVVLAFLLNPKLSFILFVAIAIIAACIIVSTKMSYKRFSKVQRSMDKLNTTVQEYLLNVRLVKAFGRSKEEEIRFDTVNSDMMKKSVSAQRVNIIFSPLMSLAVNLGTAAIIFAGSLLFPVGNVEVGEVVAFTNYMTQILSSLLMITNIFNTFVRTKASSERVLEIYKEPGAAAPEDKKPMENADTLVFDHVCFGYPSGSGREVLHDISFSVQKGETLAVIGPTGSGKSTIAWLTMRFYDPTKGDIYLNGTNLRALSGHDVREDVSIAPQQSMLFSGTVAENIKWSNPNAENQLMEKAAGIAQAEDFIRKMPDAYESVLGQSGVNVSGGQKQRLSLSRALLKEAGVLVLDDCTGALDAVTEAKVHRGLRQEKEKRAVVMITQRIGTAMAADRILVLDRGAIVGYGTHAELMHTCPEYLDIFRSQIGKEDEIYG
jgi:ATP-binding cassette subfamily B multidrug efflux pump